MKKIRVRFAPSPTGFVHVGSLRTALYNYLFARHHHGDFILRIEDTDRSRYTEGAVDNLLQILTWCGLSYDEGPEKKGDFGPYFQSKRLELYKQYANQLISVNHAYPCFCSADRLEKMREEQIKAKQTPKYDGHCRHLTPDVVRHKIKNEEYVIRMKIPPDGMTTVNDIIRGRVDFQHQMIDDQVLLKSDGFPTYHLANVVDDHLMEITHIIRGEEWLISTPKHILLYSFFDWDPPQFAHLPLLLNPDRSKLSKRQGDVAVEDYQKKGYLPEALLNFVALLGWNRGDDKEIFTIEELIDDFSLERVSKSGAVFNLDKLNWMNGLYIREMPTDKYLTLAVNTLKENGLDSGDEAINQKIVLAVRKNLNMFSDIKTQTALFFADSDFRYSQEALNWISSDNSKTIFACMKTEIENISDLNLESFKVLMANVQNKTGIKGKDLWMPVRSALTGSTEGPELPQVVQILGKEKILNYLERAINQ